MISDVCEGHVTLGKVVIIPAAEDPNLANLSQSRKVSLGIVDVAGRKTVDADQHHMPDCCGVSTSHDQNRSERCRGEERRPAEKSSAPHGFKTDSARRNCEISHSGSSSPTETRNR